MSEAGLGIQSQEIDQELKQHIFQIADNLFQKGHQVDLSHITVDLPTVDALIILPHLQFWRLQKALSIAQKGGIVKALVESLISLPDDVQYIIDQKVEAALGEVEAARDADIGKLQALLADAQKQSDTSETLLQDQQQVIQQLEKKLDSARFVGSELVEKVDRLETEKKDLDADLQTARYSLDVAAEQASQSIQRIDNLEKELLEYQNFSAIAQEETNNMAQRMRLEGGWLLEDGVAFSNDEATRRLAVSTMRIVELKAERDQLVERVKDMRSVIDKTHDILEKQVTLPQMLSASVQSSLQSVGQTMLPSAVETFGENSEEDLQIEIIR